MEQVRSDKFCDNFVITFAINRLPRDCDHETFGVGELFPRPSDSKNLFVDVNPYFESPYCGGFNKATCV